MKKKMPITPLDTLYALALKTSAIANIELRNLFDARMLILSHPHN